MSITTCYIDISVFVNKMYWFIHAYAWNGYYAGRKRWLYPCHYSHIRFSVIVCLAMTSLNLYKDFNFTGVVFFLGRKKKTLQSALRSRNPESAESIRNPGIYLTYLYFSIRGIYIMYHIIIHSAFDSAFLVNFDCRTYQQS